MRYYFLLLVSLSLFSCQKDTLYHQPFPSYEITLVYMVADNDLASYALKDLNEIERGFVPNGKDKLLVYIDSNTSTALPSHPVLLEIVPDTTEIIKSKIVASYPEQNSVDKVVMSNILKDALNYYKGDNRYKGLVLWSHGNAWLPDGYHIATENKSGIFVKSFGKDMNPREGAMDLPDLAEVLSPYRFDYILFDACFMGSVEVLYELRHSARYFIASPAEILADGFPYHLILPYLIGKLELEKVAMSYYNYYNALEGARQSATITLADSELLERLAALCQRLDTSKLSLAHLQQYSRNNEKYLFDLKQILLESKTPLAIEPVWQALCKVEKHTPRFANITLDYCNGLSVYLLGSNKILNTYYQQLSWCKDTKIQYKY